MITAHSGSDGYAANSLEFVQAMLDANVDAIELDVHMSPDQTLYLSHDVQDNWQAYPQLSQVFEAVVQAGNSNLIINVDCKHGQVGPLALALARDYQVYDQVILSGALDLANFSQEDRNHLFYNLDNHSDLKTWPVEEWVWVQALADIALSGVTVVQSYYKIMDELLIDQIHQSGLGISLWTIDDLHEIDQYLRMGADHITTNKALAYRQTSANLTQHD